MKKIRINLYTLRENELRTWKWMHNLQNGWEFYDEKGNSMSINALPSVGSVGFVVQDSEDSREKIFALTSGNSAFYDISHELREGKQSFVDRCFG